jgi:hypothetical protein
MSLCYLAAYGRRLSSSGLVLSGGFRVMVDSSSLAGRSSCRSVGPVGSELDHLLGAVPRHGADELAGEEHLEQGRLQAHGDHLAGEVPAC